jgi:hypothetical protein
MKNIKLYGAIILFLFLIASIVTANVYVKKFKAEKARADRLFNNNIELTAKDRHNVALIYSKDEFAKVMTDSLKSALKQLKIRPKTITKIIEKEVKVIIEVPVEVPVKVLGKDIWSISDSDKCFTWAGVARLKDDSLSVTREKFTYQNTTTDYFYRKLKFKFLFVKIYSRKEIDQKSISECGESTEKTITVIK